MKTIASRENRANRRSSLTPKRTRRCLPKKNAVCPNHTTKRTSRLRSGLIGLREWKWRRNTCLPMRRESGYEDVVMQDVAFRTENIQFRKEKYYSPSQKRTSLATLPTGYSGQFGPGVRAWVLALYYADGMSEPKILDFLRTVGLSISAGQISDLLIKDQEPFHAESAAVVQAGLASSPWHHLDSTGTRVNGNNEPCHILCNPLYTAYRPLPAKDRMTLLRVLLGGADPVFEMNDLADGPAAQARREGEVVSPASHAVVARPPIHREPPRRGVGSAPAHLRVRCARV